MITAKLRRNENGNRNANTNQNSNWDGNGNGIGIGIEVTLALAIANTNATMLVDAKSGHAKVIINSAHDFKRLEEIFASIGYKEREREREQFEIKSLTEESKSLQKSDKFGRRLAIFAHSTCITTSDKMDSIEFTSTNSMELALLNRLTVRRQSEKFNCSG